MTYKLLPLVLCYLATLASFVHSDSTSRFDYLGCVEPWRSQPNLSVAYDRVALHKCLALCQSYDFAFIRGQQCGCSSNVATQSRVAEKHCSIACGNNLTCGGNLGMSVYCNRESSKNACDTQLSQQPILYPVIEDEAVDCLGSMCGFPSNANVNVYPPSDYFPQLDPQSCISFCAYKNTAYAHLGLRHALVQPSQGNLRTTEPAPYCICRNSTNLNGTKPSDCSHPCEGNGNFTCGNGNANLTEARWTVYCTTKYFAVNSTCVPMDQFQGTIGSPKVCSSSIGGSSSTADSSTTSTPVAGTTTQTSRTSGCESTITRTTDDSGGYQPICDRSSCLHSIDCYFNGHCYHIAELSYLEHSGEMSIKQELAQEACRKRNEAQLVAIETLEERQFITETFSSFGVQFGWADLLTSGFGNYTHVLWNWSGMAIPMNETWDNVDYLDREPGSVVWIAENQASESEKEYSVIRVGLDSDSNYILCEYELLETTTSPSSSGCSSTSTEDATTEVPQITTVLGSSTTTTTTATATTSTTTTPSTGCFCKQIDAYNRTWTVQQGTLGTMECPQSESGESKWECMIADDGSCAFRTEQPSFVDCHSQWLTEVHQQIQNGDDAVHILKKMDNETGFETSYFGHEMPEILETLQSALDLERQQTQDLPSERQLSLAVNATSHGTSVLSHLVTNIFPWNQIEDEVYSSIATQILNTTEQVGSWLTEASRSANLSLNCEMKYPGVLLGSLWWNLNHSSLLNCNLTVLEQPNDVNKYNFPSLTISDSSIAVSGPSGGKRSLYNAVGVIFNSSIIAKSFPGKVNQLGEGGRYKQINSVLLSYVIKVDEPSEWNVTLVFRHHVSAKNPPVRNVRRSLFPGEEPSAVLGSASCSFLNFNSNNEEDWSWDTEGCQMVSTNKTHTICQCNHLTSFADLMDVHNYTGKELGLEVTTIICSSVSVISLAVTITLLSTLRTLKNDRTAITQNLCASLMISHMMILTVFDKSYFQLSKEVCAAFGVILHYTFLASFTWMAVEGLRLCQVIIDTFRTGTNMTAIFYLLGYGVPFLIVMSTVTVAALTDIGVIGAYVQDETCWLATENYIWSFVGPVAVILLVNTVFLVVAVLTSSRLAINKTREIRDKIWSTASLSLSLSFLLGLSWVLGYFLFAESSAFAYLFTVVNGLQGLMIFLFRCVFNDTVRHAIRRSLKKTQNSLKLNFINDLSPERSSHLKRTSHANVKASSSSSTQMTQRTSTTGCSEAQRTQSTNSSDSFSSLRKISSGNCSTDSAWSSLGRNDSLNNDDIPTFNRYSFDVNSDIFF